MIFKDLPNSVKDIDSRKGIVTGYFSSFGNKDSDGDIILSGAFKKTIEQRGPAGSKRIKHLKNHDSRQAPGVLIELVEDGKGLAYVSQLAKGNNGEFTTLAKDTLIEYEAGIITEHSVGFETIDDDFSRGEKNGDGNNMYELRLWEGSSLTAWGANPSTPVTGVKSHESLINQLKYLNAALKIGTFSDEKLERMEKEWKELQNTFTELLQPKAGNSKSLLDLINKSNQELKLKISCLKN